MRPRSEGRAHPLIARRSRAPVLVELGVHLGAAAAVADAERHRHRADGARQGATVAVKGFLVNMPRARS
jgi:hypothetical protein